MKVIIGGVLVMLGLAGLTLSENWVSKKIILELKIISCAPTPPTDTEDESNSSRPS